MKINYRINKKEQVENFKKYTKAHTDRNDKYNSKGKQVQHRSDYVTLEKIKSIYNYIINNIKLDLRKEFIHDDDAFKSVINLLATRVNNKIRSRNDGNIFMIIGIKDNSMIFYGDDDEYKENIINNKNKQAQVVRKIVDELNSILDNNNILPEKGKAIINSSDIPNKDIKESDLNIDIVHIVNKFLENINKNFILEIFKGDFSNFDKAYFDFMKENNIDLDLAKKMIENIHSKFIDSEEPMHMLNDNLSEVDGPKKQIYQRFDDPGIENRREKSMELLRGRNLEPRGGGWHDRRGNLVATIGDRGEVVWKSDPPPEIKDTSDSYNRKAGSSDGDIETDQPAVEPEKEIETGLSDKELEYLRKNIAHKNLD